METTGEDATTAPGSTGRSGDGRARRSVLVVTYFFPPVGGVGVQRTLKYVKYLARWGWQPVVLTPRDPGYAVRDASLLSEVPAGVEVHRTLSPEPSRAVRLGRRFGLGISVGEESPGADVTHAGEASSETFRTRLRGLLRTSARTWNRTWGTLLFPDETIAWVPSALVAGARTVRRRRVAALYSSAPPVSAHLIAGTLKAMTGKPWVADFRDPWIGNPFTPPSGRVRGAAERRTERWIVEHADRVVLAMDALRDIFVRRYPEHAAKFVYIPNGYDRAEVPAIAPPARDSDTFRIVYTGSLYRRNELEVFLAGVELLLRRRPDLRPRLRVDFVGRVNEANARTAARFAPPERLGGVVSIAGFVPRPEALARMASADALLQLMAAEQGAGIFVGGKLLEYLAMDRPILAVMPPGEGRTLVEGLPGGRTADVEPESIAAAVERLVDDPPAPGPADPDGRYDRVNLAGRLAAVLDEVVAERRTG